MHKGGFHVVQRKGIVDARSTNRYMYLRIPARIQDALQVPLLSTVPGIRPNRFVKFNFSDTDDWSNSIDAAPCLTLFQDFYSWHPQTLHLHFLIYTSRVSAISGNFGKALIFHRLRIVN